VTRLLSTNCTGRYWAKPKPTWTYYAGCVITRLTLNHKEQHRSYTTLAARTSKWRWQHVILHAAFLICICVLLYTTVGHNKPQNSSDNLPSYRIIQIITNIILWYAEWLRISVCLQLMRNFTLIHDLLFLPISTIESGVSLRVVTHSRIRAWLVHAWVHTSSQAWTTHGGRLDLFTVMN